MSDAVDRSPGAAAFGAGAVAGLTVDLALFPLDTMKTRLQAKEGFRAAGGFTNIYRGLGPAALASVPGGALFFGTYEHAKVAVGDALPAGVPRVAVYTVASAIGECAACLVRVPADQVKQRLQVGQHTGMLPCIRQVMREGSAFSGYGVTVGREIPFAAIQLTCYETLKRTFGSDPAACAVCGAIAGGLSAAMTTPIDVAKTRIMLSRGGERTVTWPAVVRQVYREEGASALLHGLVPRVTMISIGGAIFFFAFEAAYGALRYRPTHAL